MFPDLIALLFFSREYAHREHLLANKASTHNHLQEFYEDLLEKIDDLVETAYGCGITPTPIPYAYKPVEGLAPNAVLGQHLEIFRACRDQALGDSKALSAIADEVEAVYARALYKLNRLL
jgi:hypothetical protein